MATLYHREKKNNLELYLNDVYEKECVFKTEKEEIEFVQTGIETLVQKLVDKILTDDLTPKIIRRNIPYFEVPEISFDKSLQRLSFEKSLAEVYFPLQHESSFQRYVAEKEIQVKSCKCSIIKVGSFYDGTKNNFPDEFDFIFPLLGVRKPLVFPYDILLDFEESICKHAKHLPVYYTSPSVKHEVTSKIEFDTESICTNGPAYKLRFIYHNGSGQQRHIHVDLVPALKIIESNTQQWFEECVRDNVEPKTFREEILAAGRGLVVSHNLAFTEIEQHFMKNILSKKHVKVYRILKYLLNGHGDGEKLKEDFREDGCYTSYRIKILIIYHHDDCKNTDTENMGPCVLQVLQELSRYEYIEDFPKFILDILIPVIRFTLLPYLNCLLKTLRSMQTSEECYGYETDKIMSVSGQYMDFCMTMFDRKTEF